MWFTNLITLFSRLERKGEERETKKGQRAKKIDPKLLAKLSSAC
jgi:hypothetical protein